MTPVNCPHPYNQYFKAQGEFRGHAMTRQLGPAVDGERLSTISFFHQDDARRGQPSVTLSGICSDIAMTSLLPDLRWFAPGPAL